MPVRIAQISDTHLSPAKPFFHDNFDRIAEHLVTIDPDIVVNTGDLSLDGADSDDDLTEAAERHAALHGETYLLPGNHDVGDHPDVARRQPANEERLKRYRRLVGDDSWTFDIPGWRMLGINAMTIGTELPGAEAQRELVIRATETLAGRKLAIFLHKPLADERYDEDLSSNRFLTQGPRGALLAALGTATPATVLCGHVHQYRDTIMEGTRHIWAPAASFIISDPWQPGYGAKAVGYLLHEFHADGRHRHRLMTVRGLVHHDLAEFPGAYGDVRAWGKGNA
jgi:3',5'-cyclic AMP phosphodiesterase CpdA